MFYWGPKWRESDIENDHVLNHALKNWWSASSRHQKRHEKDISYFFKVKMYQLKIIFTSQAIGEEYLSLKNRIWFVHSEINLKSHWKFPLLNISRSKKFGRAQLRLDIPFLDFPAHARSTCHFDNNDVTVSKLSQCFTPSHDRFRLLLIRI